MKNKSEKPDYSVGFIYAILLCSMLLVFPLKIMGMEALPVILFLLCIAWMITDIWQINLGKRKLRSQYRRLDMAVIILLVYEVGLIAVNLTQKIEENEPEPDYSSNLLMIDMALLYLLVMEAGNFRKGYLDAILYGGLITMAMLLLGYLFDTRMGETVRLWEDPAAMSSYLIMIGIAAALQYCRCEDQMRRFFYVMCAGFAFFLLACNHSVISFWIVACTLLTIPVLIRPTACLCKRAMQMLLLFLLMVSSMGLLANDTGLFLTPIHYDAEHCVCLEMIAAVGGVAFFYCWYRKPKDLPQDRIVMRGFYKLDKLVLRGMVMVLVLFVSGGASWKTLSSDRFGFRGVTGFAVPLLEEMSQNQALIYSCMREQGVTAAILCIAVLVLLTDRMVRSFGWGKPTRGMLCVIAVSLLPQMFLWEMALNILPAAIILLGGAIGAGAKPVNLIKEDNQGQETSKTDEVQAGEIRIEERRAEQGKPEEEKPEETGLEEIDIEEIVLEEITIEKPRKEEAGKKCPEKKTGNAGRRKSGIKAGRGRVRK